MLSGGYHTGCFIISDKRPANNWLMHLQQVFPIGEHPVMHVPPCALKLYSPYRMIPVYSHLTVQGVGHDSLIGYFQPNDFDFTKQTLEI